MSRDYLDHAHRHHPHGTDPIKGLGVASAYGVLNGVGSFPTGSQHPAWASSFFSTGSEIVLGPSGLSFEVAGPGFYQLDLIVQMVSGPQTITDTFFGGYEGIDDVSASLGVGSSECFEYGANFDIFHVAGSTFYVVDSTWTFPVRFKQHLQFNDGPYNVSFIKGFCIRHGEAPV